MKTQKMKKLLMPIGMLLCGSTFIVGHYTKTPDVMDFIKGVGVGVVIMSLFVQKPNPAC